ncbi:MAG: hypothetical protein ACI4HN_06570, partial [Ruminococcus sp.]
MKYLIADLVTEIEPKYDNLRNLAKLFEYYGDRNTDIFLSVSEEYINSLIKRMVPGTTIGAAEEFSYAGKFCKSIIKYNAMLIHSSAIEYKGKAYLFAADSGVGKSTHTALWRKAFGNEVKMINDDKPVVRIIDGKAIVYGTPFDGGSGIANNISAPLGAVVFIERGENNSIRKAQTPEIIRKLYFSTAHFVSRDTAGKMLTNFENLISCTDFYILTCNMDISAAHIAREAIVK